MAKLGLAAAGWFLLLAALAAVGTVLDLRPEPGAQSSLEWAQPSPSNSAGVYEGYSRFTANELNRLKQGHELREIRYVGADSPSRNPATVSVNPIDNFTWGAAAFSSETHRCYVMVAATDRTNTMYGSTTFGWLPEGDECLGRSATPVSAAASDWPDAGRDRSSYTADVVMVGLVFLPPIAVLFALWKARGDRAPLAAIIRLLPLALLLTVAWWFLGAATVVGLDRAWTELGRWEYTAAFAWAIVASIPLMLTMIAYLVPRDSGSRNRKVGLACVAALLSAIPVMFVVVATSIL